MTRAAWSQVDITPPLGTPLGGMGVPPTLAQRIRDRLQAHVLLLQDHAGNRIAIISIDTVGITPQWGIPLRTCIAAVLGCPLSSVLLNASHTHSGAETTWDYYATSEPMPALVHDYLARISGKIITAVQTALARLAPAQLNWHRGQTNIAVNRRMKTPEGLIRHRPNPAGFVDRDLDVLHIATSAGQAVLYCAACHTVSVYGAEPDAISSDFIASTRAQLARRLPPGTHAQFVQGFAGDCRPRALGDSQTATFRPAKPGEVESIGAELAADILRTLGTSPSPVPLSLGSAECFMPVYPGQPIPRATLQDMSTGRSPSLAHLADWWLARIDAGIPANEPIGWSLGALKLSPDHWLIHTAGEPVGQLAPIIKSIPGTPCVATLGYSQDYTAYLPTDAMLPEGGYEVFESNVFQRYWPAAPKSGIDQLLHDRTKALIFRLLKV